MTTIGKLIGYEQIDGEVGIEIEVEGRAIPQAAPRGWNFVRDGSLRGNGAGEFVFYQPTVRRLVETRLETLWNSFKEHGTQIAESVRTSTHVHINIRDLTVPQLFSFICCYIILEESLISFCGEHRKGNNFCLSVKDAEYTITALQQLAENPSRRSFLNLNPETLRYAGMNLHAIARFGSLEFRTMRGTQTYPLVLRWTNILLKLKDVARQFNHPSEVVEQFSAYGAEAFGRTLLGDEYDNIVTNPDTLWEGMRVAQDVAYSLKKPQETGHWNRPQEFQPPLYENIVRPFGD